MTKTWELKNVLRGKLGLDLNNQLAFHQLHKE